MKCCRGSLNCIWSFDVFSPWGGEEYVAVLSPAAGYELFATANRRGVLVEQLNISSIKPLHVAVSCGSRSYAMKTM